MNNEQLKEIIAKIDSTAEISEKQYLTVVVSRELCFSLAKNLKENNETKFDYLINLTGVHLKEGFEIVYHLNSTTYNHTIVLKTKTADQENPTFDSVFQIWKSAEFHEREYFDLMGIKFNNHPDLRRIFLEDDWVGFPLRKDYVDEQNIVER